MTDAEQLGRLIVEAQARDGTLVGRDRRPFSFARWIEGVNAGRADEAQHYGRTEQGRLS